MNTITINTLSLHQFKGVSDFTANLGGQSATVYGMNGTGKSTLADAYLFLLTGKNNMGETFDPFPVDESGSRKHEGQEPTVEAEFSRSDDSTFTLKRTLIEKRTRKTGHTESTYTGDESKCWIDGVPTKITEYNAFIEREFASDSVLRLLTCTGYFTQQIKKMEDKRALLFQTFGDMKDSEILEVSPELAELAENIGRKSVADYHKMVKEQLSDTCKQLDLLPVRIDEAVKSLVEGIDINAAESSISKITVELSTLRYELANDKGDPALEMANHIAAIEHAIDCEKDDHANKVNRANAEHEQAYRDKLREAERQLSDAKYATDDLTAKIERGEKRVAELETDIQAKRDAWQSKNDEWNAKSNETFVADDESCPTCGQPFPPEKLQEMEANWNERKSEHLSQISKYRDQIQDAGKNLKIELDKCNAALESLKTKRGIEFARVRQAEKAVQDIKGNYTPYEPPAEMVTGHEARLSELQAKVTELEQQLSAAEQGDNPDREIKQQRVVELETQLSEQQQLVAQFKASEEAQRRIDDYSNQQRELGGVRDNCEKMLHLCELFIQVKSEKITENINKHFKIVRFALFETLKNGGLKQICETTVDGVPFDQMNRARQVAACLDIISTFGSTLGLSFPVFIDDSEGVFETYGVSLDGAQQIKLIATEDDRELRVEVC